MAGACVGVPDGRFHGAGAPVLDDDSVCPAARDDPRVAAISLRIVQERHQRALFAAVAAAQHAKPTLLGIAVARVAMDRAQRIAERRPAARDHRVVGVDHAFAGSHVDARRHHVEAAVEARIGEERHSGLSGPLLSNAVRRSERHLPVQRRGAAQRATSDDGHGSVFGSQDEVHIPHRQELGVRVVRGLQSRASLQDDDAFAVRGCLGRDNASSSARPDDAHVCLERGGRRNWCDV
jgi:hypothetical protein